MNAIIFFSVLLIKTIDKKKKLNIFEEHTHSYYYLFFSMGRCEEKIGQCWKLCSASNEAMQFTHTQQICKLCFVQKTQPTKFTDFSKNGAKMDLKNCPKLTALRWQLSDDTQWQGTYNIPRRFIPVLHYAYSSNIFPNV